MFATRLFRVVIGLAVLGSTVMPLAHAQSACTENGGTAICTSPFFRYGVCDEQIDTVFAQTVFCNSVGGELLQGGYSDTVICVGWAPMTEARVPVVADYFYQRLSGVGSCPYTKTDSGWGATVNNDECRAIPTFVDGLEIENGRIFDFTGNYSPGCTQQTSLKRVDGFRARDICPAGNLTSLTPGGANTCSRTNDATCPIGRHPTQPGTGNKQRFENDIRLSGPNPLTFDRTYNSFGAYGPPNAGGVAQGMLGPNWRSTYDRQIFPVTGSSSVMAVAWRQDGLVKYFSAAGNEIQHEGGATEHLDALTGGAWRYTTRDDSIELYDAAGHLLSITDRNGFAQTLNYNTAGQLTSVVDAFGRSLSFTYDDVGRLVSIFDPLGNEYDYGFDTQGSLVSVGYPGAAHNRTFQYGNDSTHNGGELESINDENGIVYVQYQYDSAGRVSTSFLTPQLAGGTIDRYSFVYNTGSTTITTSLGETINYGLVTTGDGTVRMGSLDHRCAECGISQSKTYDSVGFPQSQVDFNGTTTLFTYDDARGLETQRVEAASTTGNASPAEKRTIQTDWNSMFHVPSERRTYTASGTLIAKSNWTYNTRGQLLTRTETDPQNAAIPARTWTTTYCEQSGVNAHTCPLIGLTIQVDGPRTDVTDVTTYTYRAADDTTCATGGACTYHKGDLWKVTDALGHVTQYVSYDKAGRVTRMQDANATYTDMTYHARGWLLTRTVRANANGSASSADATTTFAYDNVGNVVKTTQPDGAYVVYTYDDAHRLTDITDNLGNTMHYSLDAAGNRTQENTSDTNGVLMRTLSRSYDQLSQLHQATNALNQSSILGYDGNGNPISNSDPLNVQTTQSYDALNRLSVTLQDITGTDPQTHNASTHYAYDALDNLVAVTDPNTLITHYGYDALHDVMSLQSPDTGTTSYTYDAAGNRRTQTDARGITGTNTYDALNRLTGIGYPTGSLNVVYAYDQQDSATGCNGSYPVGRLTAMIDSAGSTTYCYDRRGNVLKKTHVTAGITLTTQYSYNTADRLLTLTYPSGASVSYGRDTLGRITTVGYQASSGSTTVPIVSGASYLPMGPLAILSYANGISQTRQYNQNYQIAAITNDGGSAPSPANAPANDYHYDDLYRLKEVDSEASGSPVVAEAYSYNLTGDRQSKTLGVTAQSYGYTSGTHLLAHVGSDNRSYDANGNTLTSTSNPLPAFTFDDRNRLASAHISDTPTDVSVQYDYNGRGERVLKTSAITNRIRVFINETAYEYNEAGQLLGEYVVKGNSPQREYIYLDGAPIAYATRGALYYIETDHLGTPRALIDPARHVAVWTWDMYGTAFGEHAPNQDPDGDGTALTFNLRYPGQYYDSETGLNYNYFRDYEPGTGRYVESDPIGLKGGVNTYGYARGNSLSYSDRYGQFAPTEPLLLGCIIGGPANPECDYAVVVNVCKWGAIGVVAIIGSVGSTPECSSCKDKDVDRCKGLRDILAEHEERLRKYLQDPHSPESDNKGHLANSPPERFQQIIDGRIAKLLGQIENFRKLLEECEQNNGVR
jgi:RHS repeat-associated protein